MGIHCGSLVKYVVFMTVCYCNTMKQDKHSVPYWLLVNHQINQLVKYTLIINIIRVMIMYLLNGLLLNIILVFKKYYHILVFAQRVLISCGGGVLINLSLYAAVAVWCNQNRLGLGFRSFNFTRIYLQAFTIFSRKGWDNDLF